MSSKIPYADEHSKRFCAEYSKQLRAILEASGLTFLIQKEVLAIDEVADPDSFMCLFAMLANERLRALGVEAQFIVHHDDIYLCNIAIRKTPASMPMTPLLRATASIVEALKLQADGNGKCELDPLYRQWHAMFDTPYGQGFMGPI